MSWKFWQRWLRRGSKGEARAEDRQPSAFSVLLSHSSPQEILGLQKLIGNQAVLRILAADKVDGNESSA